MQTETIDTRFELHSKILLYEAGWTELKDIFLEFLGIHDIIRKKLTEFLAEGD